MRIRRFTNESEFWKNLQGSETDVLPLWFADTERDWIARTVDADLAVLDGGRERSFESTRVGNGASDWVLVRPAASEALLAKRYASITGRPLVFAESASLQAALAGGMPHSLTWFCPLDDVDIASAFEALQATLTAELGRTPPLGVLTAESACKLSWVLAKQLLPQSGELKDATTIVSMEPPAPSSLVHIGEAQSIAEAVAGMNAARGALFIHAHSRPHCGILKVTDGFMGMCGLATGGAGGRCVDGTACFFGEAPRVVLQHLPATRVYFNGCTTAGVASPDPDFLPRESMVSHAALRGAAREFVGNVRIGHYDDADLDWFLGVSALGYTPAQCVEVVEKARTSVGREMIRSTLYFGDATNAAWPVQGVVVGQIVTGEQGVFIRWPRSDRVLIARVPSRIWAELAKHDRLYAGIRHPSQPGLSVIEDPFDDASLVLVSPRTENGNAPAEIEIVLLALAEPVDRSIGGALAPAVEHIRWLETRPAFEELLAGASRRLEEELAILRRAAYSRMDLLMLPELIAYVRNRENESARRFDDCIIDEALVRSRGYWNWQREYTARAQAAPRMQRSSCPICGGFASEVDFTDWANPGLRRLTRACAYCGILADLPVWDLQIRIVPERLFWSSMELRGEAEVSNEGARVRRAVLGVAVERAGEMLPESVAKAEVFVEPGKPSTFAFSLKPVKPMAELFQTRVYIASEGAFGLVSTNLLYRT